MSLAIGRKSVMTLYTGTECALCHGVRLVLGEKDIAADILNIDARAVPEDLIHLNPYGTLPTLVDRDLVLYNARIVMEYIDERFPFPPLMPLDPVARARTRLMLYRIEQDWYQAVDEINSNISPRAIKGRKVLRDSLIASAPLFSQHRFFMGGELSLVDCSIAPILWRLPQLGIELPAQAQAVLSYSERLFARAGFKSSLTETEREMRG